MSAIHYGTVCQVPSGAGTLAHRRSPGKAVGANDVPVFRESKRKTSAPEITGGKGVDCERRCRWRAPLTPAFATVESALVQRDADGTPG